MQEYSKKSWFEIKFINLSHCFAIHKIAWEFFTNWNHVEKYCYRYGIKTRGQGSDKYLNELIN
jgi:hypothetical protein